VSNYANFTTLRLTIPDPVALATAIRSVTADQSAVLVPLPDGSWRGKKTAPWSVGELAAAQAALDTTATLTAQLAAQRVVDGIPIETKAIVLALIDALNVIRAALPAPLAPITPAQAIAAIRAKAGTL